ncbi:hypothetical protein JTE90_028276 [Oedothorax gibbosus]|uniref:RNA polymerase II subunit A C-terminal domain phosphatase n=1 Tax=Oedothorax gibbosus TaxID=931172 RepID=A0AAV6UDC8_9ARAC|nr:hypothetical protein JTE90_028276 [Oedothorax gibbosus]
MAENMQSYSYEGAKPITLVKWKIRKGSQLSQTVLFHYKQEATNSKEPILKFKSTIGGTVSELVAAEGEVIKPGTELLKFQPCSHPVIMKDLCGECGMDLRQMDRENFEKLTSATTFSMVHIVPELKVSFEQAEKLASDDEDRLLKNKKLVLLVDLDQTLIHTTNDQVPKELPDVHHFQLYGQHSPWYHTKLRPGTQTFLENISKYYELHICTFGARLYAHKIAQILDQDGKFFSHRILSRDECFDATSKTGNLKALFPRGDGMVCIIDDREDVWNFAPNVIRVKPYNYFRNTGDINAPPNKQVGNNPVLPNQNNAAVSKENTITPNQNQASNENKPEETGTLIPNQNNPAPDTAVSNENKVIEPKKGCPETKETMQQNGEAPNSDSTKQKVAIGTDTDNKDIQKIDGNSGEKSEEQNATAEKKDGDVVPEKPIDTYWDDHHADDYLLYLEEILMSVHKTYYEMHSKMIKDKQKGIPDLKMVVPYVRQRVLKNTNIVFSSVIPTNCVPENHYLWSLAESLGAQVSRELELKNPDLRTTHVVASKEGTVKVNVARKHKKIHVVSLEWLLCCADRWEHADERLFPLEENEANELSLNDSINARAKQFKSLKRKHNKEEPKEEDDDNFSERIFVEAGLSLSKEDIEDMDKEIDDACSVESSESDSSSSSSSIESLSSGDYPKGWKKRKRTAQEPENETAETSDAETIGSVDEEMAEAVKQEFNSF